MLQLYFPSYTQLNMLIKSDVSTFFPITGFHLFKLLKSVINLVTDIAQNFMYFLIKLLKFELKSFNQSKAQLFSH